MARQRHAERVAGDWVGNFPEASDVVFGMGLGTIEQPDWNHHVTYYLVFQEVIGQAPAQSTPAPTPSRPAKVPALAHPVQDPARRVISQRFGENPQDYERFGLAGHAGLDFAVPEGSVVCAVDAGEVLEAGELPDYGTYIKLHHPWGESLYAHLSRKFMQIVGAPVHRGMNIGLSGNTGNSTGPHLHFAIRIYPYSRGAPFDGFSDPAPYLINAGSPQPQPTSQREMVKVIALAALEFDVDSDLLLSQAWAESSFNPRAVSSAGAKGLLQIMDATWAEWSAKVNGGNDPFDARQNARVGAAYLAWLIKQTKGNIYDAVVAYGWGIGNLLSGESIEPYQWTAYANKIIHGRDVLKAVGARCEKSFVGKQ